jgi:two-component system alkaline phosphatase synthesis response regulator PhoP
MAKKILVIDDDPGLLELVGFILEQQGYEVITALDGSEGLRKVMEEKPDCLILDIMLPGIDGIEVCRYLRANPKTANLPILMLTAKALPRDQKIGFESGADDYLTKPFALSELVKRVKSLFFFFVNGE